MRVEGANLQATMPPAPPAAEKQHLIDEAAIKAILYLGLKGEIKLEPKEAHSVDTFA
ncbi:MAG: hypothetical protein JW969_09110 [Spirochaetales bacterium]|nr:hypothetical protein [Spirochaetales bacterium]